MWTSSRLTRRHIVLINDASDDSYRIIFLRIKALLFDKFSHSYESSVRSIILQANAVFQFDQIVYDGIQVESDNVTAKTKFLNLAAIVEKLCSSERSPIKTFLTLLLNLEGLHSVSSFVEIAIKQEFSNIVKVVHVNTSPKISDSQQTLLNNSVSTSRKNKKPFCTKLKYCFGAGVLAAFLIVLLVIMTYWKEIVTFLYVGSLASTTSAATKLEQYDVNMTTKLEEAVTSSAPIPTTPILSSTTSPSTAPKNESGPELSRARDMHPDIRRKFRVKSYQAYITAMNKVPLGKEITVSIVLQSPLDWPKERNIILPKSTQIKNLLLDGPIAADDLIYIIGKCPNLELLHLRNTNDQLCKRNQGQLNIVKNINTTAYLPLLRYLVIQDFTNCMEVYETLTSYIEPLRNVKRLTIHRSIIDDQNQAFFNELLNLTGNLLKEIIFAETQITTVKPLFEGQRLSILNKVEKFRLDSISNTDEKGEIVVGRSFHKIFPNLKVLWSEHGFVKWSNFPNVLRMKSLTKTKIGIDVPLSHKSFNVSFFGKYLPLVTEAIIILNCQACDTRTLGESERIELTGWETVRESLRDILILSNCKIIANMSNKALHNSEFRRQEYGTRNGKNMFAYKMIDMVNGI